jgi:hypothetical protein
MPRFCKRIKENLRMNDQENSQKTLPTEDGSSRSLIQNLTIAGIGLLSLANEYTRSAYRRSLERGELTVKQRQEHHQQADVEKPVPAPEIVQLPAPSQAAASATENVLKRMNLPSRNDIEALNRQIAALGEKIDELARENPAS